jgi:hypothetical protein
MPPAVFNWLLNVAFPQHRLGGGRLPHRRCINGTTAVPSAATGERYRRNAALAVRKAGVR